jgi:DNA-binding PadR family transcriptional regulator
MSSIRLFILDAFERHGEMHGHQLRLLAEQEHIHRWTDITVGALYGAIKRLASEGLLEVVRTEREGNFPERHIYRITEAGKKKRALLFGDTMHEIVIKPDPFDLALARLDPDRLDDLERNLDTRRAALGRLLEESVAANLEAHPYLTVSETHALKHREHRIQAEIDWLESIRADLPAILADERSRIAANRLEAS